MKSVAKLFSASGFIFSLHRENTSFESSIPYTIYTILYTIYTFIHFKVFCLTF